MPSLSKAQRRFGAALVAFLVLLLGWWSYGQIARKARPRAVQLADTVGAKFPFYYRWLESPVATRKFKIPKSVVAKAGQAYQDHCGRRIKAAGELVRLGTNAWPAVPTLIGLLDRKDHECSFAAASVLARISAPSHPLWPEFAKPLKGNSKPVFILRYLIFGRNSYLRAYDAAHRRFAIAALGAIGPAAAAAYPELMEFFKYGEDQEMRGLALHAAARIDTGKTLPLLKDTLKNEAEWPQVSASAAMTLAEVAPDDPETRKLLRAALQDSRSLARIGAGRALWRLKAPASEVLPVMTDLLNHKLVSIRKAALAGIVEMGSAALPSRADLERMTKDENEAIRNLAESALRSF